MTNCPICENSKHSGVYLAEDIPIFQNKIYNTIDEALSATKVNVSLSECLQCKFVFNSNFNPSLMGYDLNYQNEQNYSPYFRSYLDKLLKKLQQYDIHSKKVIEIGCGKGYFIELLNKNGIEAIGFDPAYEGNNPNIIKDYFSEKYSNMNADFIILRHTLEHIQHPLDFLNIIAKANNYKGKIFIEVPDLDWIIKKKSFWDIHYEHCNYFTLSTASMLFNRCDAGYLFNGQYIYVIANLKDLKRKVVCGTATNPVIKWDFDKEVKKFTQLLQSNNELVLWGAAAKGSTFLNILDKNRQYVKYLIDINPKKQNKFLAGTGHQIFPPTVLKTDNTRTILLTNENYMKEVNEIVNNPSIKIICL